MLANYLHKLRAGRVLPEAARSTAISQLGESWNYQESKLSKSFMFPSYEIANNFLLRYNAYCGKVNRKPKWKNVYNTVTITLQDTEFEDLTTKEIEVANYLDQVYDVSLNFDELMESKQFSVESVLLPKAKRR